jgi:hypothetical protein
MGRGRCRIRLRNRNLRDRRLYNDRANISGRRHELVTASHQPTYPPPRAAMPRRSLPRLTPGCGLAAPAVLSDGRSSIRNMAGERQALASRRQVVALRRAGKSVREIKAITGIRSNRFLTDALRGVPPPAWTYRPNAKDDARVKARELRAAGHSYNEIADRLGVARSSVSLWVRDMPCLDDQEILMRKSRSSARYWAVERSRREEARRAASDRAQSFIGSLSHREILIAGATAYWCEGTKNKAYRRSDQVSFINSDARLVVFFLRFLSAAEVGLDRVICRVYIHENADVAAAQRIRVTGLREDQFREPTMKRHNPVTTRREHRRRISRLPADRRTTELSFVPGDRGLGGRGDGGVAAMRGVAYSLAVSNSCSRARIRTSV